MTAVIVKIKGPTNTQGTKVVSITEHRKNSVSYDYSKSRAGNARNSFLEMGKKYNFNGVWLGDVLPNGDFVFIKIQESNEFIAGTGEIG